MSGQQVHLIHIPYFQSTPTLSTGTPGSTCAPDILRTMRHNTLKCPGPQPTTEAPPPSPLRSSHYPASLSPQLLISKHIHLKRLDETTNPTPTPPTPPATAAKTIVRSNPDEHRPSPRNQVGLPSFITTKHFSSKRTQKATPPASLDDPSPPATKSTPKPPPTPRPQAALHTFPGSTPEKPRSRSATTVTSRAASDLLTTTIFTLHIASTTKAKTASDPPLQPHCSPEPPLPLQSVLCHTDLPQVTPPHPQPIIDEQPRQKKPCGTSYSPP
nr:uncharacterized protein LOC129154864 [Nothobranchius furzeri]